MRGGSGDAVVTVSAVTAFVSFVVTAVQDLLCCSTMTAVSSIVTAQANGGVGGGGVGIVALEDSDSGGRDSCATKAGATGKVVSTAAVVASPVAPRRLAPCWLPSGSASTTVDGNDDAVVVAVVADVVAPVVAPVVAAVVAAVVAFVAVAVVTTPSFSSGGALLPSGRGAMVWIGIEG